MTFGSSARIIEVAPAGAWGVLGISGGGVVAEAPSWEIDEDFVSIADWTIIAGSWGPTSEQLDPDNSADGSEVIYSSGQTFTNDFQQYAKFEFKDKGSGQVYLLLRLESDGSGYAMQFNTSTDTVTWVAWDNWGYQAEIQSAQSLTIDNFIGAEVYSTEGVGNSSTEIRVWTWNTDPGARANWGAVDVTFTDDPGTRVEDTGDYVGFCVYEPGTMLIDNLQGGSAAAP